MQSNYIFIQVRGFGVTCLLDNKIMHNFINPDFLNFFKEEYPATKEEYQTNQMNVMKLIKESKDAFPILPKHLKTYHFKDVYEEVGYKVVKCSDNKQRKCKAIKFNFEYEGHLYSELFYINQSQSIGTSKKQISAILGVDFLKKHKWSIDLNKRVINT